ncbi:helix-turn-helix transcriptional regulator [Rhizobium sp. LjRoot258]
MSHRELADAIGVTYQPLQKYERGASRINASRLKKMAVVLNVPVSLFLETHKDTTSNTPSLVADEIDIIDFLSTDEGRELNVAALVEVASQCKRT